MHITTTFLFFLAMSTVLHAARVIGGRARPAIRRASNLSTTTESPSTPPPALGSSPSGAVGQKGYSRFHANDTLVGRSVPCTRDEKICFRYNMLFDPKSDRCQPFGGGHPPDCQLTPNRTEFERGSGHLYGVCNKYQDPCTGYRMAYDGRCYRKEIVRDIICGCGAEPTRHFLGGMECRCSPTRPASMEQPTKEGRCFIPDLRFPADLSTLYKAEAVSRNGSGAPAKPPRDGGEASHPSCSEEQKKCFELGQVWVTQGRDCFPLLQRGPCAKEQVVALSPVAWARQSAECRPLGGGCPPGQQRMAVDSQCHDAREAALTAPGRIALDIFGEYEVVNTTEVRSHTPRVFNGACVVFSSTSMSRLSPSEKKIKPVCVPRNDDLCSLHEVVSDPPAPEYKYVENGI